MTSEIAKIPNLGKDDLTRLAKFAPKGTPDLGVYLRNIQVHVMGTDKVGNPRPIEDFYFFMQVANRAGLDPLANQIYAVYRWDSRIGREKMSIQTSIDGLRLVAQRSKFYGGQDDIRFTPEDESTANPTKATATVYRLNPITGERLAIVASARWNEYVQLFFDRKKNEEYTSEMWKKKPYLMLGKCAEALALRKAFPQELSGLYIQEEMEQTERKPDKLADLKLTAPKGKGKKEEPKDEGGTDRPADPIDKKPATTAEEVGAKFDNANQPNQQSNGEEKK